ncbi:MULTISPECIES: hypothetical protein [unclassified Actinomadura]|uniref:hypothetical protein n=1 Tax=unclassified Actinomadura TaxID=2626254 RepID=UPI0011F06996|nr:hypothetical protein [Actinomadura sp. K4S16]
MAPKDGDSPVALPYNTIGGQWNIGVDFVGLAGLANTLHKYVSADERIVSDVNKSVHRVTKDAGWRGDAAKSFNEAWEKDTQFAQKLSTFEDGVGDVIADLAVALAWIQKKLVERVDELARTVGLTNFGGDPGVAQAALRSEQAKAGREADKLSQKAQKEAAEKLIALYSGKAGGWSAVKALDDLEHNQYVPRELQKTISKIEDGLREQVPGEKSLFDQVTGSKTLTGLGVGGTVGAFVGGVIGVVGGPPGIGTGAAIGGLIGSSGGGIWGGIEDLF